MTNVVIVGYGSIAKKHEKVLRELVPDVNIYALRSNSSALQIPNVTNVYSYDNLSSINPHFFIISNSTIHHESTLKKVIPFGVPIFIEKPSLHNLESAENIIKPLSEKNILTYVACNLRFLDCIRFVKKELDKGGRYLNEVNVYAGSYLPAWRPDVNFRSVYSANKEMGGGVHLDLIHEIDYLYWLFGKPDTIHKTLRSNSSLNINAFDYANYNMVYSNFVANAVLNYYRKDYKRTLELVFEDETWLVDLKNNNILSSTGDVIFESSHTILDTYKSQMEYFLDLIENNSKQSFNSFFDSIEVLKIALSNV